MSEVSSRLLVSLEGGVKRITFNNPTRRNSVDFETMLRFTETIKESFEDGTRVVVITGAGDSFCAGADLQAAFSGAAARDVTTDIREVVNPGVMAMRGLPKPIIARVHGHAAGIGCNYALAADIIIASDQAFFSQAFIKIGLMPDGGGTYFLPRLVGYNKAFELMALGDPVPAQQAFEMGMLNRVVPVGELDSTVDALTRRLADAPAIPLAKIKAGLANGLQSDLASALEFEAAGQGDCFRSADFAEGVAAFLQKRKAVFTGK
ncbi:MAG TPA: enoyl-CoA hydratase [Blastocatellia bacterium]|jgi:2-(1,2-epoxy-1,2-dihydrophenyl)acetyl-CoA isomerase|nr:enoyl-CoA hydratase [Blastocatellia bacterium]